MPPDAERYLDGGISTAMTFKDDDDGVVPQLTLLTDVLNNNNRNNEGEAREINVAELAAEATKKPNDYGLGHNEVLIDGVVYDISSFHHPGGDQIFLFGGNDVTVQYKMIHPYATPAFLKKMKVVRKVENYEPEYSWETPFEKELKREVSKIVPWWKATATPGFYFRVLFYTVWFWWCQYLWVMQSTTYTLAVIFGVGHAMVGLNIQHDANHGSVARKFENVWINDLLGFGADWIGSSKWLWQQQHWTHHAYTNQDRDPDLHSAEPLVIFQKYAPDSENRKWYHPYQVYYYFVALSFYGLSILSSMDFFTLNHSGATLTGLMDFDTPYIRKRAYVSTLTHVLYLLLNFGGPMYYNGFSLKTFSYIFTMIAAASLSLAVPFSVSHNFEGVQQQYNLSNPMANQPRSGDDDDDEPFVYCPETNYPPCWYRSQIETGCTYGGVISGMITGGLNFQIEHHLFPRMNSAWYPYIQPAVMKVCKKHGINYTFFPYIHQNLYSMCTFMHSNGRAHIVAAEEKARAEAEAAARAAPPKAKSE